MIHSSIIFLLLVLNLPHIFLQQIFTNKHSFCTFTNNEVPKNERTISIENTFWDITGTGRDKDTHVRFSLCKTLPPISHCNPSAAICIFNEKKTSRNIRNGGQYFEYKIDNGKRILRSVNGQKCDDGSENFTVIIQFESNPEIFIKPKFLFMDDCELRLEMMWPMFTPPCTMKEDGHLIDLRPLKNMDNFLVYEPKNNRNYSLSICQKSKKCGEDISTCEITQNDKIIPISKVDHHRVAYDERRGLILHSNNGENKRNRRYFELHLKCNWKSIGITNLVAIESKGRTIRFKAESSLACIKFPTNCHVRDKHMSYFLYDLSSLNKNYEVRNVSGGIIKINICSSLNTQEKSNDCTDQYSQVCYQSSANEIKNLGSIPKHFEVTTHNSVRATFTDGSVCTANASFTYSTEVEFICKATEEGPILKDIDGCTYKIKWFTPAACPKNSPQNDNCVMQDLTGIVNLQPMYKSTDRQVALSENSYLRFNLCGGLKLPCDKAENAAVCYIEGRKERVVGFLNKRLIIDDNVISLNMSGQTLRNNLCNTKIKFYCNQMLPENQTERVRVNIIRDKCNFEIDVETPLACGSFSTSNCTFSHNNFLYNLTGISKKDGNYVIKNKNKQYILNICRSVIKLDGALCPSFSGICMHDLDEPHLIYRYKSLGTSHTKLIPHFDNNDLIITYEQGSYCPEADSLLRTSSIHFQCATVEEGPKLVQEDVCHHKFNWRTPKACPTRDTRMRPRSTLKLCHYLNVHNGHIIDLSNNQHSMKVESNSGSYQLDLCSNVYVECIDPTEAKCTSKNATLTMVSNKSDLYLSYLLDHKCDPEKNPNEIRVHLICNATDDFFEMNSITNCIFNINLKSYTVCTGKVIPMKQSHTEEKGNEQTHVEDNHAKQNHMQQSHMEENRNEQTHVEDSYAKQNHMQQSHMEENGNEQTHVEDNYAKQNHMQQSHMEENRNQQSHVKDNSMRQSHMEEDQMKHNPVEENHVKSEPCTNTTLQSFDFKLLHTVKITSVTNTMYTIDFDSTESLCSGFICKGNDVVLPYEDSKCPTVVYNYTNSFVLLEYKSKQACGQNTNAFIVQLRLTCNLELTEPTIIQESDCLVVIRYPLSAMCSLFNLETLSAGFSGIVVGSSVGLTVLIIAFAGGFIFYRKMKRNSSYRSIPDNKSSVPVYFKDTEA
ncbi:hypothetical protein RN001_006814 [Aquatica leii]|uniref:MRH domain-containing protein n=1 Tax=Aquatica leii TaxID=1421715 RepID=A0AAN7P8P6_9COLE|nr:hypothetical protein RN001_006814 [Aquatica leii]